MAAAPANAGPSTMNYSGKTQALLRAGMKERDKGKVIAKETFPDAEDGVRLELEEMTFVERSGLETANALTKIVTAAAPATAPLPDLGPSSGLRGDDAKGILAAIHEHQSAIARDMVQREAGREALRRTLLASETVPWRVEQLQETFKAERAEQLHALKSTMASFKEAVKHYQDKFAEDEKRNARMQQMQRERDEASKKFQVGTGAGSH